MGEAVTQDRPGDATAASGGATVVHPDDAAIAKAQAEKDAFFKDAYQKTGPLDHLRPKGSDINDPDGHCLVCGANIGMGQATCSECTATAPELNQAINDYWYENKDKPNSAIQSGWEQSPWYQDKLKTKEASKDTFHGV